MAKLHISTWQIAYRGQLPDSYLDRLSQDLGRRTDSWRKQIASSSSARMEIWLAEAEGQIIGFASLGPERDGTARDTGELYAIYVDADQWGTSVGHRLMQHATARLASCGYAAATLWVLETNLRARRFYERHGWIDDATVRTERRPDGVELREVRYRVLLAPEAP